MQILRALDFVEINLDVISKTMKRAVIFLKNWSRSKIYVENNNGPKIDPWGTPQTADEEKSSIFTETPLSLK